MARQHNHETGNQRLIKTVAANQRMESPASDPIISLIIPMYDVERYLDGLLSSIATQRVDPAAVELIFVDDGSPDGCARIAEDWLLRHRFRGQVIRQSNQGPALPGTAAFRLQEATGSRSPTLTTCSTWHI
jgi:cellulose synthase/poly-beta-1,6-N-acetylglucosamine synthase-like glycosyltransferase